VHRDAYELRQGQSRVHGLKTSAAVSALRNAAVIAEIKLVGLVDEKAKAC